MPQREWLCNHGTNVKKGPQFPPRLGPRRKICGWFLMKRCSKLAQVALATLGFFLPFFPVKAFALPANTGSVRAINLDFNQTGARFFSPGTVCIGGEHAALEFNRESLRQLAIAHRACGFQFIRFHGVLNPDMHLAVRSANGSIRYNWQRIDRLYADLLRAGVKPIVELSFMPRALASGKQTVFFYRGNITPPRSMTQWSKFIAALVRHLELRFGARQVRSWYFEVWNEPNYSAFFTGKYKNYLALYAATARAVKSVDPRLRVGGPATSGLGWISQFIHDCFQRHIPLDFISSHTYGCGPHQWGSGQKGLRVGGNPESIANGIRGVMSQIRNSPMPRLPLLITEWGPSYSSRDPVHDTYFQAVYLLENLKQVGPFPAMMSYWALSDIFDEDGPQTNAFEGGFGLFNPQGIEKPSFFALKYLHQLRGRELRDTDGQSWATRWHGGVTCLAWDYRWPHQTDRDSVYFRKVHPSHPARPILLRVNHLHPGRYRLQIFMEGYRHNDAYTTYQSMGYPNKLNDDQLARLRSVTRDRPVVNVGITVGAPGVFAKTIKMATNRIVLVELRPRQ